MILFNLDFETVSTCNRTCPTCIRNSHPDREIAAPWFAPNYLPEKVIYDAIAEAQEMPLFGGVVCLNHYNEPLTDERITDIAKTIKEKFKLNELYLHTNGDFMTEEIAKNFDGVLDRIVVTFYMDNPIKEQRNLWVKSLFKKTNVVTITDSVHVPTHYSPGYPVKELAEKYKTRPCTEPSMRIVINHRRQYLLCCDDFNGNFGLGTYPEIHLADHWEQKMKIQDNLLVSGGRLKYHHCETCPRT